MTRPGDAIDAEGNLHDFIRRPGDPPWSKKSSRRKWGTRVLLSTNPVLINSSPARARPRVTAVGTQDLGIPCPIDVQMRFALNDLAGGNVPILPFSPFFPLGAGVATLKVDMRRGVDPDAPVTVDSFTVDQGISVFPGDIFMARELGIEIELTGVAQTLWVEVIATPVHEPATRDKIPGWPTVFEQKTVPSVASPANAVLLLPCADRAQFFIQNTSSNGNLILSFGATNATWVGSLGAIILPKGIFAIYESPIGGFRGRVTGSWDALAPDGNALVTQGTYYP